MSTSKLSFSDFRADRTLRCDFPDTIYGFRGMIPLESHHDSGGHRASSDLFLHKQLQEQYQWAVSYKKKSDDETNSSFEYIQNQMDKGDCKQYRYWLLRCKGAMEERVEINRSLDGNWELEFSSKELIFGTAYIEQKRFIPVLRDTLNHEPTEGPYECWTFGLKIFPSLHYASYFAATYVLSRIDLGYDHHVAGIHAINSLDLLVSKNSGFLLQDLDVASDKLEEDDGRFNQPDM